MTSCEVDETVEVEKGGDCGERKVRWEKLMPRMSLRVLLVESDESTRQLIAGLLKECCYKVMAVSDGLKAWEVLKGKPKSIDFILTEVELPSISGFALLTLIMEHESCKNIPVIMMSKNDSVNMVYKCMLRGAADFLVKPVRKNELQNLWQHVWRRLAYASSEQRLQEKSITEQKSEGLLDNGLPFDDSNDECTPENDECREEGNDAQRSCSVPDLDGVRMIQQEDPCWMKIQEGCNKFAEALGKSDAIFNNSTEVIDLIGTLPNHSTVSCMKSSVMHGNNNPRLDLSLRVQYDNSPGTHNIRVDDRKNVVHQSNASAFSRYTATNPINHTQRKTPLMECEGGSTIHISSPSQLNNFHINNSHPNTQMSSVCQESSDLRQGELFLYPQLRMLPVSVQVNDARLDRTCTSYSSSLHPSYYSHKNASQIPSPDSGSQSEVFSQIMQVPYPNISSFTADLLLQRQDENVDATVHRKNVSSVDERSQNSSLSNNGVISQLNSFGGGSVCGSNGSNNPIEGISTLDEKTNRSLLREAALNKFRQKRKDRCFEKKVRYESRKKLAEQRPRVKGQFVRKSPTDQSPQLSCKVSNVGSENSYRTGSSLVSVCLPNQI